MDSVYFLLALAIILALFWMVKQRRIAAIRHVLNRKRNSGKDKVMEELARQFIGKECIIYTVTSTDSSIQGTVKDVTDGGIVLEKDFDVIYVSSPDFFSKLEALHFGADPGGEEETLLQTAAGADLLILDDLGTEFNSNFFLSTLYSLLNNRLGAHLPTIVTTNITDGALLEKLYTEKISSRLSAFVPCLFAGQDIRSQKAQEV